MLQNFCQLRTVQVQTSSLSSHGTAGSQHTGYSTCGNGCTERMLWYESCMWQSSSEQYTLILESLHVEYHEIEF